MGQHVGGSPSTLTVRARSDRGTTARRSSSSGRMRKRRTLARIFCEAICSFQRQRRPRPHARARNYLCCTRLSTPRFLTSRVRGGLLCLLGQRSRSSGRKFGGLYFSNSLLISSHLVSSVLFSLISCHLLSSSLISNLLGLYSVFSTPQGRVSEESFLDQRQVGDS